MNIPKSNKQPFLIISILLTIFINVCLAQVSTDNILKITNTESSYPSWSADGSKIVFQSDRAGGDSEIYIMNADGMGIVRLTNSLGNDLTPVWSPDGKQIAFQSDRDGKQTPLDFQS